ncbi:MAG: galactokinase, partial [Planctomycetia bacterium]
MINSQPLIETFTNRFGNPAHKPTMVRAPGRINIIGEHTDYNEGFVLPAAIDRYIYFAARANGTTSCNLYSFDEREAYSIDLEDHLHPSETFWANYLIGTISQLKERGYTPEGFDCVFAGNVPIGAGMSSSAALECGFATVISELFGFKIEKTAIAHIGQQAEHRFAGTKCGIMDQFASLFGKANSLIKLDCRTLDHEYVSLSDSWDYHIVLANTHVKHTLAESGYNSRRADCEHGVATIREMYPDVKALRDVSPAMLEEFREVLDPVVYSRCEYVFEENRRVEETCQAIHDADAAAFGRLIYASHEGLKNKYDVSCKELDDFVDWASEVDGVLGARMMGGGFGGCTVNVVEAGAVDDFKHH